ncbi:MAG: glycerol-3-phosphate dehydrogenase C-terminal domain-containing protein, partial [Acidimicrobiales bacterium]
VISAWSGVRPLIGKGDQTGKPSDISRAHRIRMTQPGWFDVAGGKLTTYRAMATDTVDEVEAALGRRHRPSPTANLALRGARAGGAGHLAGRYGTEARVIEAMTAADPSLAEPLVPTLPYLRAEGVYAARYEMARTVDDVLSRRTRSLILDRDASTAAAPDVADLLAGELGWTHEEAVAQVDAYRAGAEAERLAAAT